MTVYLAGNLPKDDLNGLASAGRRLANDRQEARKYLIVGVVEVKGVKESAPDWSPEPVLHLTHVELVPAKYHEAIASYLVSMYHDRTGRVGLDFPDAEEPERLAVTAEYAYRFMVSKAEDGSFSIELVTAAGHLVGARHAMRRPEFEDLDFAAGAFSLESLPLVLKPYAETLLAEWGREADGSDDVVDAEVVDGGGNE